MPSTPPPAVSRFASNQSFRAVPSNPGTDTQATTRQTARSKRVNRIRDFNSGILKQFANVSAMLLNMRCSDQDYLAFFGLAAFALAASSRAAIAEPRGACETGFTINSQTP